MRAHAKAAGRDPKAIGIEGRVNIAGSKPDDWNKLSAGGVFLLCLFLGIIFEQLAIGILAGLVLGAGAGKVTAPKSDPEA